MNGEPKKHPPASPFAMPEPPVSIIRRFARDTFMENPDRATFQVVEDHILKLPQGWVDPSALHDQFMLELRGARRFF